MEDKSTTSTYDVIISTGIKPNSGTTAKITIVIHGCLGNSGPFTIQVLHHFDLLCSLKVYILYFILKKCFETYQLSSNLFQITPAKCHSILALFYFSRCFQNFGIGNSEIIGL